MGVFVCKDRQVNEHSPTVREKILVFGASICVEIEVSLILETST